MVERMSTEPRLDKSSFASRYAKAMPFIEKYGLSKLRGELLGSISGNVLEIGAGTGANLVHYPDNIELTLSEPSQDMIDILTKSPRLGSAKVLQVSATELEDVGLEPHSFDYIVSTLVLCSVPNVKAVLESLSAVLSPGGKYLFMEHGLTPGLYGRLQRIATPFWSRMVGNCHLDRDLLSEFDDSPFVVTNLRFFRFPFGRPLVPYGFLGTAQLKSDFSL